ncbi:L-rhamnose/proton symporter RhaT [Flavobacterium saccharophilum]|uniref:L-rhamnose-proton symport protein (RhaT) n=1 Tax=Flavobacterium saccharophilum TaxID=29534 RepID=A0A1M7JJ06_9FLAO|nr:L-rhamnose/proton symporter RhaT [Flavobacterium saccharophilum]SHM52945.1 L-rhamnose-proton symport protein (RhaT) [Flavobacterium saccharophilum]
MGIGILWVLMAAIMLGFYALPSKYIKNYAIENTWGIFWVLAMFVVPVIAAFALVNGLLDTYSQVSSSLFITILFLSILWGIGNLLWGISISKIGMALDFSLLIGVGTLSGSILPFFMGSADQLNTPRGMVILGGIFIIMIGIIANGKAGLLREKFENSDKDQSNTDSNKMRNGIIICVIGSICAAGFNLSYHVADNLGHIGQISQDQFGNAPWVARIAVMLPSFIGSGIATVLYFSSQLTKNKSWRNFKTPESSKNFGLLLIMALVYCTSLIIYGLGAYELGPLGTSVGFAIFQTGCIMVANLLGFFTSEWNNAGSLSKNWLFSGLFIMSIGIIVVAYGNAIS